MNTSGSQRLFVAVDPPPGLASELCAWARRQASTARGMRLIPVGNVHLTLAFLGEQPADTVGSITDAIAAAAQVARPCELRVGEPLPLPARRPRVLAVSVADPGGQLTELQAELAVRLSETIGWSDARRFRPHLTLARFGRDGRAPRDLTIPPGGGFTASELVLYRSHLEPSGARYEPLQRTQLI